MITLFNIKSLLIEILVLNAIVSAILVIIAKNPVISVVFLITLVLNSALYLIIKGMTFIGIAYILIYLGAIIVLFLFVIMMINIKLTDVLETGSQYTKNIPLALIVSGLFLYECLNILPYYLTNSVIPVENSIIFMSFNYVKNLITEINLFMFPSNFQNLPIENILLAKGTNSIDINHLLAIDTNSLDSNVINTGPLLVSNN
jgi:NADH-ubiquinone oxidoreductase chain 6